MKVPKYIRYKMHRLAKHNYESRKLTREINSYFEEKGIDVDELYNLSERKWNEETPHLDFSAGMDYMEEGIDCTEEIIRFVETKYK